MKRKFKTKPYAHQLAALEAAKDKKEYAWFMDMGTGKSKVLLDNASLLYWDEKIEGLVVFANKGSYLNWEDSQIETHLPDEIPRRVFTWVSHRAPKLLAELPLPFDGLTILIVNIEAFQGSSDKALDVVEALLKSKRCLLAVDESPTIKNPKAQRTKAATYLGKLAAYRRIMTGDPITRDPLDLWGQCEFLRPGILGCASYFAFRNTYANLIDVSLGPRSFKKITGFKNIDRLTKLIQSFSYRVKKEDCLDLPPKSYEFHYVELTKEQKTYYDALRDESIAFFSANQFVTGDMVMKRLMKLHQIVCGSIKMDDGSEITLPNNRISALMEVLEEVDGKAIIWATYRSDIRAIYEALRKQYGEASCLLFYGDTTNDERQQATEKFQDVRNPARFLVSNPATGGYGNTWTAASTVVYYSNDYRLDLRKQSEDRCHRIGQEKAVTYIDLMCKGTVDEKIVKSLQNKNIVASLTMGDEWKEWLV